MLWAFEVDDSHLGREQGPRNRKEGSLVSAAQSTMSNFVPVGPQDLLHEPQKLEAMLLA